MEILKIPWYIRKMWKRSMKSTMKYTIVHTTDYIEMTRKAKFFGIRTSRYPFDEVVNGVDVEADASYTFEKGGQIITDIARGKAPGSVKKRFGYVFLSCFTSLLDDTRTHNTHISHSPPGSSWRKTWSFESDDEIVRCRTIELEDGTCADFHTYYKRVDEDGDRKGAK